MNNIQDKTKKVSEESNTVFYKESGELALINIPFFLSIPEEVEGVPVKIIGKNFYEGRHYRTVAFPKTITHIDNLAFFSNRLESVELPDSLVDIGEYAFASNKINDLVIGSNVTHIRRSAFSHNKLTHVEIPHNVEFIGREAFSNNELEGVIIPANVKEIRPKAFTDNSRHLHLFVEKGSVAENYAIENNLKYQLIEWSDKKEMSIVE